jgi:hypothetical protein
VPGVLLAVSAAPGAAVNRRLPGPAARFIIDKDGAIYQLVGASLRSRHTYGLNHVAIGIEFVQEGGSSPGWGGEAAARARRYTSIGVAARAAEGCAGASDRSRIS